MRPPRERPDEDLRVAARADVRRGPGAAAAARRSRRTRRRCSRPGRRRSSAPPRQPGRSYADDHVATVVAWPFRRLLRMLDALKLRADFPIFEQPFHGKPLAYLDSAASSQKPRQVLDAMTPLLRDLVRERAPRRLRARRARDGRARGRPREGARVRQRAGGPRDHLRPQRDRGAQPGRRTRGACPISGRATSCSPPSSSTTRTSSPGSTSPSARAPSSGISLRRAGGELRLDGSTASATSRSSPPTSSRTRSARSTTSPRSRRGRTSAARSTSATPRRPLRTSGSTCSRSAPTSSRSRVTRCAGRAGSASSGAARSCCSRWSRS